MSFYRPATTDDFEDVEIEYSNYRDMDDETKKLIEQGEISKAMNDISNKYGMGLVECRKYCLSYKAYLFAKSDFEQGKPVFVAY